MKQKTFFEEILLPVSDTLAKRRKDKRIEIFLDSLFKKYNDTLLQIDDRYLETISFSKLYDTIEKVEHIYIPIISIFRLSAANGEIRPSTDEIPPSLLFPMLRIRVRQTDIGHIGGERSLQSTQNRGGRSYGSPPPDRPCS